MDTTRIPEPQTIDLDDLLQHLERTIEVLKSVADDNLKEASYQSDDWKRGHLSGRAAAYRLAIEFIAADIADSRRKR